MSMWFNIILLFVEWRRLHLFSFLVYSNKY